MTEEFVQFIWKNGLLADRLYHSNIGNTIEILNPGMQNTSDGPDFSNGRIRIENIEFAGNIEIHTASSMWYKHNHHLNSKYDNVILSVVLTDDMPVYNSKGRLIESIILTQIDNLYREYQYIYESHQSPGCLSHFNHVDLQWFNIQLHSLYIERLERKFNDCMSVLETLGEDWSTLFYRLTCRYWATKNTDPFVEMARLLPYRILLKYADQPLQLEALLFGVSGMLDGELKDAYMIYLHNEWTFFKQKYQLSSVAGNPWNYSRVRPEAFPTIRIAMLANYVTVMRPFYNACFEESDIHQCIALLNVQASSYWDTHYRFGEESEFKPKLLGEGQKNSIAVNVLIPFIFTYSKYYHNDTMMNKALDWIEELSPENNGIVHNWERTGYRFSSALQTQALIQLNNEYCQKHNCINCAIGCKIISYMLKS